MLPYVVIFLGILYLVLHYSGALEDLSQRKGRSPRRSPGEKSRRLSRGIDREIEQRLKVFEDFLKQDEPPQEDD